MHFRKKKQITHFKGAQVENRLKTGKKTDKLVDYIF